jgi:hypothetical protein
VHLGILLFSFPLPVWKYRKNHLKGSPALFSMTLEARGEKIPILLSLKFNLAVK